MSPRVNQDNKVFLGRGEVEINSQDRVIFKDGSEHKQVVWYSRRKDRHSIVKLMKQLQIGTKGLLFIICMTLSKLLKLSRRGHPHLQTRELAMKIFIKHTSDGLPISRIQRHGS